MKRIICDRCEVCPEGLKREVELTCGNIADVCMDLCPDCYVAVKKLLEQKTTK